MFYSKSTGGFYLPEIHGDAIPADAVEITAAEHAALLAGQVAGKIIAADATGAPVLQDPPPADPVVPAEPEAVTKRKAILDALGLTEAQLNSLLRLAGTP